MPFSLGLKSLGHLEGVHPKLVAVVKRAIQVTSQDFAVTDGLRTLAEQKRLLKAGATKTMNSKHLPQADGFSHAVDLVPFINGGPRWEWGPIWRVALAVGTSAKELGVNLTWGAVWDRSINSYCVDEPSLRAAVEAYKVRHPGPDFLDGPHYQLRVI